MRSNGPPVLGLAAAGLLVVVAVLLLAGLGIAVGAGIFVGMLLGLAGVGAAMAVTRRNTASGWSASLSREDAEASPGLFQDYGQALARVADVDSGVLTRVVPLEGQVTAGGVRVETIAAELRADGGIISLVTHARPPVAPPGHFGEVRLADDVDTDYVAAMQGTGQSSPSTARFEIRFSPAPPSEATELRVEIVRFVDPFPHSSAEPVHGPWTFTIDLGSSPQRESDGGSG